MKTLKELVRPNIWKMKPYSSARDEFHGSASVFLDANENPYNTSINRYPDPMQWQIKDTLCRMKGVAADQIFLGNGSDEPIDLLMRVFCEPGIDNIVSIDPSYGMYEVAANINNVAFKKATLNEDFDIDVNKILSLVDDHTKLIYLCSPNNPTGNSLSRNKIIEILNNFDGIVVVDEAYNDFSSSPSFIEEIKNFSNLVVLQTLSKAWGAAGIRLGMAFSQKEMISIMNKVKYPYNINILTQIKVVELLAEEQRVKNQIEDIIKERQRVEKALSVITAVKKIYHSDANFLLIKVDDANALYNYLVERGIIVRNRTNVSLCEGCIRITIGTPEENNSLIKALTHIDV